MSHQLKVYYGPESDIAPESISDESKETSEMVSAPLHAIFPMLVDAVKNQRTWLADFGEEEVALSSDLYDVIMAYQHFRPSA